MNTKLIVDLDITRLVAPETLGGSPHNLTFQCAHVLRHIASQIERDGITGFYQNVHGYMQDEAKFGTVAVKQYDPEVCDPAGRPILTNGPSSGAVPVQMRLRRMGESRFDVDSRAELYQCAHAVAEQALGLTGKPAVAVSDLVVALVDRLRVKP